MAFGGNRSGTQTRASFQTAGGSIYKFRHPFLAGALDYHSTKGAIDEIDISKSMKLDDTFFEAKPTQDSSKQVVMVDGSTVAITNSMLNGIMTIRAVRTTGKVASGDFVAALQLIVASKDSVGGTLLRTKFINGEAHSRLYYGISVKSVPHDIDVGLDVPVYACELYYAGFIDFISASADVNQKAIWAVGSKSGIQGVYKPYLVNSEGSTKAEPLSTSNVTSFGKIADDTATTPPNLNNGNETEEKIDTAYEGLVAGYSTLPAAAATPPATGG